MGGDPAGLVSTVQAVNVTNDSELHVELGVAPCSGAKDRQGERRESKADGRDQNDCQHRLVDRLR
jgi:hypothetical protein